MSRRAKRILVAVVALSVLGVLLSPLCEPPALATGAYLQAVTSERAVVCMVTETATSRGLVVRRDGESVGEVPVGDERVRHELRVDGLEPATRYEFEVISESGSAVDSGTFVTRSDDDSTPVRFAMIGDSGGQPFWIDLQRAPLLRLSRAHRWLPVEDEPRAVAALLRDLAPDFWLHTGDVVYPRGEWTHYWSGFFSPFGDLLRHAPCYPVLGNHDVMTEDGAAFLENFVLPTDGDRYFTFRDGPLRVVGLDLNHEVGPDDSALEFLRDVAASSSEPWLLVFSHFPVRSAYRKHPRGDLERHFVPLCQEIGVDLLCSGHDHNYQRFGQPGELIEVVTGGGGKSLYEIRYPHEGLVAAETAYHACLVEIEGAVMTVVARAIDGRELDRFEVDKGALLREGRLRGSAARLARTQALVD